MQFLKYPFDVRAVLNRQCEGTSSGMWINAEYRRFIIRYQFRGQEKGAVSADCNHQVGPIYAFRVIYSVFDHK